MKKTYEKIIFYVVVYSILTYIFGCSPLKRLERMEKKHPYLFDKITDTITINDTIEVIIPGKSIDTVFHYSRLVDTVTIEKDGLKTVVWMKNDSIHVHTGTDTVYIYVPYEKKIPVKRYIPYKRPRDALIRRVLFWGFPVIVIAFFVYRNRKRKASKVAQDSKKPD